jgi:hypothetical protein
MSRSNYISLILNNASNAMQGGAIESAWGWLGMLGDQHSLNDEQEVAYHFIVDCLAEG